MFVRSGQVIRQQEVLHDRVLGCHAREPLGLLEHIAQHAFADPGAARSRQQRCQEEF